MVVSGCSRSGMVEGVATDEGGSRGGGEGRRGWFRHETNGADEVEMCDSCRREREGLGKSFKSVWQ